MKSLMKPLKPLLLLLSLLLLKQPVESRLLLEGDRWKAKQQWLTNTRTKNNMPYAIVFKKGSARPWKIVRKDNNQVVGSSITKKKAIASMEHRKSAIKDEAKRRRKKKRLTEMV